MPKVTFDCACLESVVAVTVQKSSDPSDVEGLLFKTSGSKTIDLSKGKHELSYRAVGTPHSHMTLTVSKGGTLDRDVDRDLGDDGRAAGLRVVTAAMLLLALLGLGGVTANAQSAATPEQNKAATKLTKQDLLSLPAAGTTRVPSLSVDFEATSKEKTGAVSIVVGTTNESFTGGLTVSGPLDDATKTGEPLSRSGLASGASVELGLHWFVWTSHINRPAAAAICQRHVHSDSCDDNEIKDPTDRLLFLRALGATSNPVVIDVTASTGRNTFKFLDTSSYAPGKEQHRDKSFVMSVGRYTPRNGLVSVGYGFERGWKPAGAARNICTAISGTSSSECRTAPVGAPSIEDQHEIRVEQRVFFSKGRAAVAPIVAYDVKGKSTTVTVPLYFFATKDANLAGGIKGSWNSRDHDTSVAVFVGPAFTIFK